MGSEKFWLSESKKAWESSEQENPILETKKYGNISIFKMKNGSVIVAFFTVPSNGNSETHTFAPKDLVSQKRGFGHLCDSGICLLPDGSKGETFLEWREDRTLTDAEIIEKAKVEIYKKYRTEVAETLDFGPELLMTGKSLVLFREDGKFIIRNPGNQTLDRKDIDVSISLSDSLSEEERNFEIARILNLIETELVKRNSCSSRENIMCRIEKTGVARFFEKNIKASKINTLSESLTNEEQGVEDIWSFIYANLDQNRV